MSTLDEIRELASLPSNGSVYFDHVPFLLATIDAQSLELQAVREALAEAQRRSFQDARICYRGFSYGVSSQWGIDSLRSAIKENGHE